MAIQIKERRVHAVAVCLRQIEKFLFVIMCAAQPYCRFQSRIRDPILDVFNLTDTLCNVSSSPFLRHHDLPL